MRSGPTTPAAQLDAGLERFAQRALWVLATTVAALALVGLVLAAGVLRGQAPVAAPDASGPFRVADDVPVSFGVIAVEAVTKLPGLTKRAVASADHGIPGFVPKGRAELDVDITLRNTTREPVAYDPRAFAVQLAGAKARIGPTSASIRPGRLQPGATLDGVLRYVVPAKRQDVRVLFADPGRRAPIAIEAGAVETEAASASSRPDEPAKPEPHGGHEGR